MSPAARTRSKLGLIRGTLKDAQEHVTTAEKMHRPQDSVGSLRLARDRAAEAVKDLDRHIDQLSDRHGTGGR